MVPGNNEPCIKLAWLQTNRPLTFLAKLCYPNFEVHHLRSLSRSIHHMGVMKAEKDGVQWVVCTVLTNPFDYTIPEAVLLFHPQYCGCFIASILGPHVKISYITFLYSRLGTISGCGPHFKNSGSQLTSREDGNWPQRNVSANPSLCTYIRNHSPNNSISLSTVLLPYADG